MELIRGKTRSLAVTAAVIFAALTFVLPSVLDVLMSGLVFGAGWVAGRVGRS